MKITKIICSWMLLLPFIVLSADETEDNEMNSVSLNMILKLADIYDKADFTSKSLI
jgi:hypothetical protein